MICGGVDIGGTKIEARLFSPELTTLETRRVATPTRDLKSFLDTLADQVDWLQARSGIGAKLYRFRSQCGEQPRAASRAKAV